MTQETYKIFMLILSATGQTGMMVFFSVLFSLILGLPLGVMLCISDPVSGIKPKLMLYQILSRIVNVLRSFPFIILMILLFPLSRLIIGTSIGTAATIVPIHCGGSVCCKNNRNGIKRSRYGCYSSGTGNGLKYYPNNTESSFTGSSTLSCRRRYAYDNQFNRIFGYGGSDRRRRTRRSCNTIRLSAF